MEKQDTQLLSYLDHLLFHDASIVWLISESRGSEVMENKNYIFFIGKMNTVVMVVFHSEKSL